MGRYVEPTPLNEADYAIAMRNWRRGVVGAFIALIVGLVLVAIPAAKKEWDYRQHGVHTMATLVSDDRSVRMYLTTVRFETGERTCTVSKLTRLRAGTNLGGLTPVTYLPGGCEFRLDWDDNHDIWWIMLMAAFCYTGCVGTLSMSEKPVRAGRDENAPSGVAR